jgi:signal transduction histidine kinase
MRKSLYAKLALALLGIFLVAAVMNVALTIYTSRLYDEEATQKLNRGLAATIARERPVIHHGTIDWKVLDNVFDALMAVNPSIEIYLLDANGRIMAFSAPPGKVKRKTVSLAPVQAFLSGQRLPIRGDDPRDLDRRKIFSVTRVDDGYLYVILGGEQHESAMSHIRASWILQQSVILAVAALLFALVAGLVLFGAMTRRLRNLARAVESNADVMKLPVNGSGDEVDRLAHAFERQVQMLKEVDLHRRELIANVSHDLRTPLASLQGYIETLLLKEGQLSADEQRRFLEIANKHSERLGKLIDELFELAKLDAKVTPLHVEAFSMAELVQDVVQKFQLRGEQGGVKVGAKFDRALPLVMGDIALMERVLENLIENAIRYTPAGGTVTVSLMPQDGKLAVRVSDTGVGIAEESLPFIFDRFWRGEESTPRGGAGLGLAIAKRILELHGAVLVAQSQKNAGTTFSFAV